MRSTTRLLSVYNHKGVIKASRTIFNEITKQSLRFLFYIPIIRHSFLSVYLLKIRFKLIKFIHPNVTDADPLKRIWVDPEQIKYYYRGDPQQFAMVESGDWDKTSVLFEETEFYKFLKQHYIEEYRWEETDLYNKWRKEIEIKKNDRKFENKCEIYSYINSIEELYEKISKEGYKSQAELYSENPSKAWKTNNDTIHPLLNEVAINIGRDGRMGKKSSGKHRLAIAKILNLDQIPVIVRVRHSKWQTIRIQLMNENLCEKDKTYLSSHPDLRDINDNNHK